MAGGAPYAEAGCAACWGAVKGAGAAVDGCATPGAATTDGSVYITGLPILGHSACTTLQLSTMTTLPCGGVMFVIQRATLILLKADAA